jgi:hypothetical protein
MTSGLVRRARAARQFGFGVMLVGFVPVVWFVARSLQWGPELPSAWTARIEASLPLHQFTWIAHPMHAELLFALAGLAILWLGAAIAGRQNGVFDAERRAAADRLRRVQQYGGGEDRIEPYIGSPISLEVIRDSKSRASAA